MLEWLVPVQAGKPYWYTFPGKFLSIEEAKGDVFVAWETHGRENIRLTRVECFIERMGG